MSDRFDAQAEPSMRRSDTTREAPVGRRPGDERVATTQTDAGEVPSPPSPEAVAERVYELFCRDLRRDRERHGAYRRR